MDSGESHVRTTIIVLLVLALAASFWVMRSRAWPESEPVHLPSSAIQSGTTHSPDDILASGPRDVVARSDQITDVADIDAHLFVEGRVLAADGYPIGAIVELLASSQVPPLRMRADVSDDGSYRFDIPGVNHGTVALSASANGFHAETVMVHANDGEAVLRNVDFYLFRVGSNIRDGRIIEPSGAPIPSATLRRLFPTEVLVLPQIGRAGSLGHSGIWILPDGQFRQMVACRAIIDYDRSTFRIGVPQAWPQSLSLYAVRQDSMLAYVPCTREQTTLTLVLDPQAITRRFATIAIRVPRVESNGSDSAGLAAAASIDIRPRAVFFTDAIRDTGVAVHLEAGASVEVGDVTPGSYSIVANSAQPLAAPCAQLVSCAAADTTECEIAWVRKCDVQLRPLTAEREPVTRTLSDCERVRCYSESGIPYSCAVSTQLVNGAAVYRITGVRDCQGFVAVGDSAIRISGSGSYDLLIPQPASIKLECGPVLPAEFFDAPVIGMSVVRYGVEVGEVMELTGSVGTDRLIHSFFKVSSGECELRIMLGGNRICDRRVAAAPGQELTVRFDVTGR